MTNKKILLIIGLIFVFLLNVNALESNQRCFQEIIVETGNVQLYENQVVETSLTIKNLGESNFFVEKLNEYDFGEGVSVKIKEYSRDIKAKEEGLILLEIKASTAEEGTYDAFLQLKGVFEDGLKCNYYDFMALKTQIKVNKNKFTNEPECEDIKLTVPERVSGNGEFIIPIKVVTNGKSGLYLTVSGENTTFSGEKFFFEKGIEKEIEIRAVSSESGKVSLKTEVEKCNPIAKEVLLVEGEAGLAGNDMFNAAGLVSFFTGSPLAFLLVLFIAFIVVMAAVRRDEFNKVIERIRNIQKKK